MRVRLMDRSKPFARLNCFMPPSFPQLPWRRYLCNHSLKIVTADHSHAVSITGTDTPCEGNLVPDAVGTCEQSAFPMFTRKRGDGFPASPVTKTAPSGGLGKPS